MPYKLYNVGYTLTCITMKAMKKKKVCFQPKAFSVQIHGCISSGFNSA